MTDAELTDAQIARAHRHRAKVLLLVGGAFLLVGLILLVLGLHGGGFALGVGFLLALVGTIIGRGTRPMPDRERSGDSGR